ncbi:MAG: histidine kinase, partial [Gammaproteobacteria bacterium]|nr:histidine kinase [Gammaproteobacteria bacterium]
MEAKNNKTPHDFFLPDFCQAQSLFLVVLVTELLAVLFTAFDWSSQASFWSILAIYSVSIQMVTLFSIASLCLLRNWLSNFDDWMAGLLSLSIILFFTLLFSLMVIVFYWILPIDLTDSFQLNFIFRNILVSSLIGAATLRYFYLQLQYRKQLTLQTSAKLDALQARIRPHFLFNSMNVIASLTQIDADKAESAIEDLSDLFRVTLDNAQ